MHRSSNTVVIGSEGGRRVPQLTDIGVHAALTTGQPKRLLPLPESSSRYQEVDGFLPLPSRTPLEYGQSYRAITSLNKPGSDSDVQDDDSTPGSESDNDSDILPLSSRQEALRAIEQHLTAEPSSISAWAALLDHSLGDAPPTSKNAKIARSEIAASILHRALKASPENKRSAYIWIKLLKAGEEIWERDKLNDKWEEALSCSESADVWVEWFDWRIRSNMFGIQGIKDDACRALRVTGVTMTEQDLEVIKLRLFWRMAVFLKESGARQQ